jgi:hypothetical protein
MDGIEDLQIRYADHPQVREMVAVLRYCAESISLAFDGWDDPRTRGPGLYVVVVAGTGVHDYADPMGDNRWPVDVCDAVGGDVDALYEAAREVAFDRDGAVVVSVDGSVLEQMVRMRDRTGEGLSTDRDLAYAEWMGARHMSAVDTSAREEVVAAVTLSEEIGRAHV